LPPVAPSIALSCMLSSSGCSWTSSCFSIVMVCFFNATATTELYTLSLHDALPILRLERCDVRTGQHDISEGRIVVIQTGHWIARDRKSTRLNSSHVSTSYAVFCLKKKKLPLTQSTNATTRRAVGDAVPRDPLHRPT